MLIPFNECVVNIDVDTGNAAGQVPGGQNAPVGQQPLGQEGVRTQGQDPGSIQQQQSNVAPVNQGKSQPLCTPLGGHTPHIPK